MNRLEQYIAALTALIVTVPALLATNTKDSNRVSNNIGNSNGECRDAEGTVSTGWTAEPNLPPGIAMPDRFGVNQDADGTAEFRPWGATANAALISMSNDPPPGLAMFGANLFANSSSSMIGVEEAAAANAPPVADSPDNTVVTPEPASTSLLVLGGVGLLAVRRRRTG